MRNAAAALGLVAIVALVLGWLQNPSHITAHEAVTAAEEAFVSGGVRGATVAPVPAAGVYKGSRGERIAVWKTSAKLHGGTVELWLARADGELVFLDDRSNDGSSRLLTDKQFQRLAAFHKNPGVPRQVRRNVALTFGATLVMALGARLSMSLPVPDAPQTEPATPGPDSEGSASLARPPRRQPLRARPLHANQETA